MYRKTGQREKKNAANRESRKQISHVFGHRELCKSQHFAIQTHTEQLGWRNKVMKRYIITWLAIVKGSKTRIHHSQHFLLIFWSCLAAISCMRRRQCRNRAPSTPTKIKLLALNKYLGTPALELQ